MPGAGEPESTRDAFDRGQMAGKVNARLEGHDAHFAEINGSISKLVAEVAGVANQVQRLADKFEASEKTVITTAAALEKADIARRTKSESSWSPLARWATAISIIGGLIGLALLVLR